MKNTKKKLINQSLVFKSSFTDSNITKYSGLNSVGKYINRQSKIKKSGEITSVTNMVRDRRQKRCCDM